MTELADIFNEYGHEYIEKYNLPQEQLKVISAITSCRTSKLGGHADICDSCGHLRISYNSCRNRHCPKCQVLITEKWIKDRKKELLPIQYYHIVFTIPNILNDLVLNNLTGKDLSICPKCGVNMNPTDNLDNIRPYPA